MGPGFPLFARLLLLFTIVPLIELFLLIRLGQAIGAMPTVALVLVTGIAGATLARMEGLRVLFQWQRALASGRLPEDGVLSGLLILVGAAFLVTPGILTDVFGLALLFAPTRRLVARRVRRWAEKRIRAGTLRVYSTRYGGPPGPWPGGDGRVIDVQGERIDGEPAAGESQPRGDDDRSGRT